MKFPAISLFLWGAVKQTCAQKSPLPMSFLDENGDGIVTKEEAEEFMKDLEEFKKDLDLLFDTQADATILVEDHLKEDSTNRMRRAKQDKSSKDSKAATIARPMCEECPAPTQCSTITCPVSAGAAGRRSASWSGSPHRSASCTSLTSPFFRLPVPIPLRSIVGECWCGWTSIFILEQIILPFRFVHIPDHLLLPSACANPTTINSK